MSTPNTHYTPAQIECMLDGVSAVYFLGIGGISMSSLAALTQRMGRRVGGYDRTRSALTDALEREGITIDTDSSPDHLDGYGAVVYTVAISADQSEYAQAVRRGLPLISRANYMGYLMTAYRHRIGVAGTHGKSTTTGMLSEIFMAAEQDPTVLCGAVLPSLGAAYRMGRGDTLLFEACEYMDSFLDFYPTVAVLLNTELDHVDYFPNIARMRRSYAAFADKVGKDGTVIANADDPQTMAALSDCIGHRVTFGMENEADYRAVALRAENGEQCFSVVCRGEHLGQMTLRVSGKHNVYNALAALAAAREQGICMRAIRQGLYAFGGVHRRMEYKGTLCGAALYDDYAHHPTEIRASIGAARELRHGRLICVFQSHTYSRTAALFDDFVSALSLADAVVIAPIYAAREQRVADVGEASLAAALRDAGVRATHGVDFADTAQKLKDLLHPGDTALVMGAGDIEKIYPYLITDCQ